MRRSHARTLCGVLLVLAAGAPRATAQSAYAVNSRGELYVVDFAAGTKRLVGAAAGAGDLRGLALSPTGTLYGTNTAGELYALSPTTGAATYVGSTGRGNIEALDFWGNTLYGVAFADPARMFTVDLGTAATTDLPVTTGLGSLTAPRAAAFLDATTVYFTTVGRVENLVRVDLATGGIRAGGGLGYGVLGIDFLSDGNLYGLTASGWAVRLTPPAPGGPADVGVTFLFNTGDDLWEDMAGVGPTVVPEPATVVVLGAGLGALGALGARVHRRRAAA